MNFRARLRLFFVLLVIVPMIALAVVLFTLTVAQRDRQGRRRHLRRRAHRLRRLRGVARHAAEPALREVAADPQLTRRPRVGRRRSGARMEQLVAAVRRHRRDRAALVAGRRSDRARRLARAAWRPRPRRWSAGARCAARCSSRSPTRPTSPRGCAADRLPHRRSFATAACSPRRSTASAPRSRLGERGEPHAFELAGDEYRGRVEPLRDPAGRVARARGVPQHRRAVGHDRHATGC